MNPVLECMILAVAMALGIGAAYKQVKTYRRFHGGQHHTPTVYHAFQLSLLAAEECFVAGFGGLMLMALGSPPPSGIGWKGAQAGIIAWLTVGGFVFGFVLLPVAIAIAMWNPRITKEDQYREATVKRIRHR